MEKSIRIACEGAAKIALDQLTEFQGELKILSKDNFDRLRKQIIDTGFSDPVSVWRSPDGINYLLNGHQRTRVLRHMEAHEGYKIPELPVVWIEAEDFKEAKKKLLSLASQFGSVSDQGLYEYIAESGLDWRDVVKDFSFPEIDPNQFAEGFFGETGEGSHYQPTGVSLTDKFIIPPFSIFDCRQGYWQERKRMWKEEIGDIGETRDGGGGLGFAKSFQINPLDVSLLDPVMSEAVLRWFTPSTGCQILDPFAGDTVFGYVSKKLGHHFTGIELRAEQAKLNQERCDRLDTPHATAKYINDTSENIDAHIADGSCDLLFSCPPYYDLEIYSDDPRDLSTQESYQAFNEMISEILKKAAKKLKPDRFAVLVVGEIRGPSGSYQCFVPDTVKNMISAGLSFYNEIILATSIGNASMRADRYMGSRKVVKVHQNVLVFYKGNPKDISKHFPKIQLPNEVTDAAYDSDDQAHFED